MKFNPPHKGRGVVVISLLKDRQYTVSPPLAYVKCPLMILLYLLNIYLFNRISQNRVFGTYTMCHSPCRPRTKRDLKSFWNRLSYYGCLFVFCFFVGCWLECKVFFLNTLLLFLLKYRHHAKCCSPKVGRENFTQLFHPGFPFSLFFSFSIVVTCCWFSPNGPSQ